MNIAKSFLTFSDIVKYGIVLGSVLLAFSSLQRDVALLNQKLDYLVEQSNNRMEMTITQQRTIGELQDRIIVLEQRER